MATIKHTIQKTVSSKIWKLNTEIHQYKCLATVKTTLQKAVSRQRPSKIWKLNTEIQQYKCPATIDIETTIQKAVSIPITKINIKTDYTIQNINVKYKQQYRSNNTETSMLQ